VIVTFDPEFVQEQWIVREYLPCRHSTWGCGCSAPSSAVRARPSAGRRPRDLRGQSVRPNRRRPGADGSSGHSRRSRRAARAPTVGRALRSLRSRATRLRGRASPGTAPVEAAASQRRRTPRRCVSATVARDAAGRRRSRVAWIRRPTRIRVGPSAGARYRISTFPPRDHENVPSFRYGSAAPSSPPSDATSASSSGRSCVAESGAVRRHVSDFLRAIRRRPGHGARPA
jgi:hypothetical protein